MKREWTNHLPSCFYCRLICFRTVCRLDFAVSQPNDQPTISVLRFRCHWFLDDLDALIVEVNLLNDDCCFYVSLVIYSFSIRVSLLIRGLALSGVNRIKLSILGCTPIPILTIIYAEDSCAPRLWARGDLATEFTTFLPMNTFIFYNFKFMHTSTIFCRVLL